ncbi:hypothetical protein C0J52_21173 [Blattella germanica]|nr:hypothetical protein C0J52_21173 [Blattella germanica]
MILRDMNSNLGKERLRHQGCEDVQKSRCRHKPFHGDINKIANINKVEQKGTITTQI